MKAKRPARTDETECLAQSRPEGEWDLVCTRPKGHKGAHVAHGHRGHEIRRWRDVA